MKEEIVPATTQDYIDVYGERPTFSMRLWKVVEDGRMLAIFGFYYVGGSAAIVCKILNKFPPKKIYRVAKVAMEKLKSFGLPLIALADEELCTAPTFLRHLGFEHVQTCTTGEVYEWANTRHTSN